MGVFNLVLCMLLSHIFCSFCHHISTVGIMALEIFQQHPYACKQASQPIARFENLHKALQTASSDTVF